MSTLRLLIWSMVVAGGIFGPFAGGQKTASAVTLSNTASVASGGLTFTFSACTFQLNSGTTNACAASGATAIDVSAVNIRGVAPGGARGAGFLLQDAQFVAGTPGADNVIISSVTANNRVSDVRFTVTVTGTSSSAAELAVAWAQVKEATQAGTTNSTGTSSVLIVSSASNLTTGAQAAFNAADAIASNLTPTPVTATLGTTGTGSSFSFNVDLK